MKLIININEDDEEIYWKFMELKSKYKLKTHTELLYMLIERSKL